MLQKVCLIAMMAMSFVLIPSVASAQTNPRTQSMDNEPIVSTFVQRYWSNEQMRKHVFAKIEHLQLPNSEREALRTWYSGWLERRQQLLDGSISQLPEDAAWDRMDAESQEGRVFFHPSLNPDLVDKPVVTRTDPRRWATQADCDHSPYCFAPGDPKAKGKGAVACKGNDGKGCGRVCKDGATPIQGCSAWCCEGRCGCAGLCLESKPEPKPDKP